MARLFDGVNQYLSNANAVVSSTPLSMACWVSNSAAVGNDAVMCISDGDINQFHGLYMPFVAKTVRARTNNTNSTEAGPWVVDVWTHIGGVWTNSTSRVAYRDGNAAVADNTDRTPAGLDYTTIGCFGGDIGRVFFFEGMIAEVAVWNAALTTPEMVILAARYSPLFVRPQSLVAYWRLIGRTSPEIDLVGGFDMTLNNAPTQAPHPGIIYPTRQVLAFPPMAAPPVVTGRPTRLYFGPSSVRQVDRSYGGYHG